MNLGSKTSSSFGDFWEDPSSLRFGSPLPSERKLPRTNSDAHDPLTSIRDTSFPFRSINEAPDFHDPFSDLSLFLARQVRKKLEMERTGRSWSAHIQDELVRWILPEFEKLFPKYLLSTSALKRVWEKGSFYLQQLENQPCSMHPDGSVDLEVMIRENFRSYETLASPYSKQPYFYAQHLAMKVSECVATLDGIRLDLHELTCCIWHVQKHLSRLSNLDQLRTPFDEKNEEDEKIVQLLLDTTASTPTLTIEQLREAIRSKLGENTTDERIERWVLQGDMVARSIRLPQMHPRLVAARDALALLLKKPGALLTEIPVSLQTAAKLVWYNEMFPPTRPTWERWLLWHALLPLSTECSSALFTLLTRCSRSLPWVPFLEGRCRELLAGQDPHHAQKEERESQILRHVQATWQEALRSH